MGFFVFSSHLRRQVSQSVCNKNHTDANVPNCHLRATAALPAGWVEDRQDELSLTVSDSGRKGTKVPMKH